MTVKQHTPSRAQRSTSARTTNRPATPARPKDAAASEKKSGKTKRQLTPEQTAQIEAEVAALKDKAHGYATKAYSVALSHFYATEGRAHRFARSLLVIDYERDDPEAVALAVRVPESFAHNDQVDAATFRGWRESAEFIARVLEQPGCPDPLKEAVSIIYTDLMNESKVSWTAPEVMRLQLPLILLDFYNTGKPAEADTTREILVSLCQEMGDNDGAVVGTFTNED